MHRNPHAAIDPQGLQHEVGNVSVPQSVQRNGLKAYPNCIQTVMYASGALIPTETQLSGLERRQNSVMGSRKTVRTVRDEDEKRSKSENPTSLSCGSMSGLEVRNFPFHFSSPYEVSQSCVGVITRVIHFSVSTVFNKK